MLTLEEEGEQPLLSSKRNCLEYVELVPKNLKNPINSEIEGKKSNQKIQFQSNNQLPTQSINSSNYQYGDMLSQPPAQATPHPDNHLGLRRLCENLGSIWHDNQRLPFDHAYEPLGVISTEVLPSTKNLERLNLAKKERNRQNEAFLNSAIHELMENNRAEQLILLLSPPNRF